MENFDKEIQEIEKQLEELKLKRKREERKNQIDIGIVSIIDDRLKLELLLNADDFSEEHIERLTKIANELQELLLDVYKDVNKGEKK